MCSTEDQLETSAKSQKFTELEDEMISTDALKPSLGSVWNDVTFFPSELPRTKTTKSKPSSHKPYKCRHCKAAFKSGNDFGGHMRKKHLG